MRYIVCLQLLAAFSNTHTNTHEHIHKHICSFRSKVHSLRLQHELTKNNHKRYGKVDMRQMKGPQLYTDNDSQLTNVENKRNSLNQRKTHRLVI